MTEWIWGIWRRVSGWFFRRRPGLTTVVVDDVPENCSPNTIYLVGDVGQAWAAALRCPCGCGDVIHLSLLRESRPRWRVEKHQDGSTSIFPSVWRSHGCRSHFWVRRSEIEWALAWEADEDAEG